MRMLVENWASSAIASQRYIFCLVYLIFLLVTTDLRSEQARRQDSVTGGGAEINFGGTREVYFV